MADIRKKEGFQRIQIGLTGLAGVLLLVGLANIVVQKVRLDVPDAGTATSGDVTKPSNAASPSEPLAELGVTPQADKTTNLPTQTVPDLQPDPNLAQPMDR